MNRLDRLYLERANELAMRAAGNTSPNPAVGAVVVAAGVIAGEGYHHRAGEPHAEVHALQAARDRAQGATLYVSLEPCNHTGRTPPCSHAVVRAGIARVVVGCADPNPRTDLAGIAYLRQHGVAVEVADDERSRAIVEPFARSVHGQRPYVTLKMALSLDGYVASAGGVQQWLTSAESRERVRELRTTHDAVAVGAGTVRIDNPRLTVRPPQRRLVPYRRVVVCERDAVDPDSLIFVPVHGYDTTLVLAPAAARERFRSLESVAHVLYVGDAHARELDISLALRALRDHGIATLLCEGGPTLAAKLFEVGAVDRFYGLVAPQLLRSPSAVPVLTGSSLPQVRGLRFDRVERVGADLLVSGMVNV